MQVKCGGCGNQFDESQPKCPKCKKPMSDAEKFAQKEQAAKADAQAKFAAAQPAPGAALLAARVGDMHVCPQVTVLVPHVGGPLMPPGVPTVLIGGMPAAMATCPATCVGPVDAVAKGSATVLIGGQPAARLGDMTAHGGIIVAGCPTVVIGG